MKIVFVGAGAVGKVFAQQLHTAGIDIAFYSRIESAEKLNAALETDGLSLVEINQNRNGDPVQHKLKNYQVLTDINSVRRFKPDQIWVTTQSQVLYSSWYRKFLEQVPKGKIICFAPEGKRSEFIPEKFREERFVFGGITFIAWQGELGDGAGQRSETVYYWVPPLLELALVGDTATCREVAQLLKMSGFRVSVKGDNYAKLQASLTGIMTAFTTGLELAGWSLNDFRRSEWLFIATKASRESVSSQLKESGFFTKSLFRLISTFFVFFLLTYILPYLFPFDIERYLKFHYIKAHEQTIHLLRLFINDGKEQSLPVGSIELLFDSLVKE